MNVGVLTLKSCKVLSNSIINHCAVFWCLISLQSNECRGLLHQPKLRSCYLNISLPSLANKKDKWETNERQRFDDRFVIVCILLTHWHRCSQMIFHIHTLNFALNVVKERSAPRLIRFSLANADPLKCWDQFQYWYRSCQGQSRKFL